MNKKGQALIEFILIMPVILLILISFVDLGKLYIDKINLTKDLDYVEELYKNNKNISAYTSKENINYEVNNIDNGVEITLTKNEDLTSPLNKIIKTISVKRNVYE